jgi:DNA-binding CsgD family transcriptional regulator
VARLDDLAQRHQVIARDHVLDLGVDVRERVDEADQDRDDGVDAAEGADRQGVEGDIRSEVLAGKLPVVPVEHAIHVVARNRHPLLGRTCLDHFVFLPCDCTVAGDRGRAWSSFASRKSVVRDPSGMLSATRTLWLIGRSRRVQLLGRERERTAIGRLVEAARDGSGGALVVHGEPGVGKTALLDDVVERATTLRIVRSAGVEGEMELPFAAVQQLCAPILALGERLPRPQRDALDVAFGLSGGAAPSPFLVALAVLGLLSEAARERGLCCLIDDAHWLDRASAQALGFAARRLAVERIAMVFATRDIGQTLRGLPEVHVDALGHRDSRALLESVLPAPLDDQVLERLIVETGGNPLALMELPRGLTSAQLAGGFGMPAATPLQTGIEESFERRVAALPREARLLVLIAASDPTGDASLVWRAAERLRIPESAALAAESDGLIAFRPRIAFRHPLVRSAVYRAAGAVARTEVHQALAEATDAATDPDRRAWHRAQATVWPDEDVAADLERSAARAQARAGFAAAGAFLERSAALTVEPGRRARRALAAAGAKLQAGAADDAATLVEHAAVGPLDDFQRAQAEVIRARIAFATSRGSDAPPLLLGAARRLEALDVPLARETYLDALTAALYTGRLAGSVDARQVAIAALAAPPASVPRPVDLLLDGLATLIADGPTAGTPRLRDALNAFARADVKPAEALRWRWLAGRAAQSIWEHAAWDLLTSHHIRAARAAGMLVELPLALDTRVGVHLLAGETEAAAALVEEAGALAGVMGDGIAPRYGSLALAAYRGDADEVARLVRTATDDFLARGEGLGLTAASWLTALLNNGLGRYEEALAAAAEATRVPGEIWFSTFALAELVEAASRTGRAAQGAEALETLSASTSASGTPWALGVDARSRALLAQGDAAEPLYREAIERLQPTRLRLDLARGHLVYGEWLRRGARRIDARNELRAAYELFTDFGMEAFAERSRIELEATGEHARKRTADTVDQLTAQEAQISRLAAEGNTNREIAAQLFISPSTVEYHLRKAFRKLDVTSRTQLAKRLR